jgi:hypothetical protein
MMTYRQLLKISQTLSEGELKELLDQEMKGARRWSFVERLHQRYSSLRMQRERRELLLQTRIQ